MRGEGMKGLTQRLEEARSYRGAWLRPSNFESFWETSVAFAQNAQVKSITKLPSVTQTATFKRITFTSTDQTQLSARVILPVGTYKAESLSAADLPAVVLFSDLGRGVRSWLHLLRFTALGMPVVALEARPCEPQLKDTWRGALSAEELAHALINPGDAAASSCLGCVALPWLYNRHLGRGSGRLTGIVYSCASAQGSERYHGAEPALC